MEIRSIFYNATKVILFSGFHVVEVAHDFVLQLKTWILSKGVLNSFDSWHGTQYTLLFFGSFFLDDYDYFLKVSLLLVLIFFVYFQVQSLWLKQWRKLPQDHRGMRAQSGFLNCPTKVRYLSYESHRKLYSLYNYLQMSNSFLIWDEYNGI